jgi:hypothetical protein
MSHRPDLWSAVEPAHLPQYGHTAVIVGSVIIIAITVLLTVAALAVSWSYRRAWMSRGLHAARAMHADGRTSTAISDCVWGCAQQPQSWPRQDWTPCQTAAAAMPSPMTGSNHQLPDQLAVMASPARTAAAWAAQR